MFLSRYIVVKTNNNCEKRGGERVFFFFFFFSYPPFRMQSKISKKNVFEPWVIRKFTYFLQKILFKSNWKSYYKVRQFVITKCDSLIYYKVRQVSLQSATGITKCDSLITKCDRYYKVRLTITKYDRTVTYLFYLVI